MITQQGETGLSRQVEDCITRSRIFHLAWPIIVSNLSTPMLGLVDTAVIGNLGDAALIGAIAIGGMVFSFLYWGFGFLRMGTTGLVAQTIGAQALEPEGRDAPAITTEGVDGQPAEMPQTLEGPNSIEVRATFYRAFLTGTAIGILLMLCQYPLAHLAFSLLDGSHLVEQAALDYFQIRIWGAPFSLANLAVMGFLLGSQNTRALLWIQLLLNGTNILLDLTFVVILELGVPGVALASVLAEILALVVGVVAVFRILRNVDKNISVPVKILLDKLALKRMFAVNRDIMIRTLCLIFAFAWFTNQGARSGDVILAANAILMQFVSFSAFFLDGFALAAESLVGKCVGSKNKSQLKDTIRYCAEWTFTTSLFLGLIFLTLGELFVSLLTNADAVVTTGIKYLGWVVIAPLTSCWCYLLDGIFIGATRTIEMRNAMLVSLGLYLASWEYLTSQFGNHGLWAALMLYFILRSLTLAYYLPTLISDVHPPGVADNA